MDPTITSIERIACIMVKILAFSSTGTIFCFTPLSRSKNHQVPRPISITAAETNIINDHKPFPLLKGALKQTTPIDKEIRKLSHKGALKDWIDFFLVLAKVPSAACASWVEI